MRRSRSALRALADHAGILAAYIDQTGRKRLTSDRTRQALLAAMGCDAASEVAAGRTLRALRDALKSHVIPSVRVTTNAAAPIELSLARGWPSRVEWDAELSDERGRVIRQEGRATRRAGGRFVIALKRPPSLGYHALRLTVQARGRRIEAQQRLIVAPERCAAPESILQGKRAVGLTANLYTLRSHRNWGVGDTGDLRRLAEWAARIGAAFVGVNPLHALRNRGMAISPYGPVSRLFRNVLYLDVTAIPELAESADVQTMVERARPRIVQLRAAPHLDYEAIMAVKRPALEALHAVFGARTPRTSPLRDKHSRTLPRGPHSTNASRDNRGRRGLTSCVTHGILLFSRFASESASVSTSIGGSSSSWTVSWATSKRMRASWDSLSGYTRIWRSAPPPMAPTRG
jgi:4-alpha-glucanotransferase